MNNELYEFEISTATIKNAAEISQLIAPLVKEFISDEFTSDAEKIMLDSMSPSAISKYIIEGFEYFLAYSKASPSTLAGVLAVRDKTHIYHLFVAKAFHKQGVAQRLWRHYLAKSDVETFTVNSSRYAVDFYQKLGFQRDNGLLEKNGITCYPMTLKR